MLESNPQRAAEFAGQSLQAEITESFIWFLRNLRRESESEANRLFLQTLARYSQHSSPDAYQFGLLGTYLFTSPSLNPQDYQTIALTRVGNIIFPNITVNLPNISEDLARAYIRTAIIIILRPTNDAVQKQMRFALGTLLIPKAQEFAPDLIGQLHGAMVNLASLVPAEMTSQDAFKNFNNRTSSPAERLEEIERTADAATRDRLFLEIVFQTWQSGDFETAKLAASKIEDEDVRKQLDLLIQFGEANKRLKDKEADLEGLRQKTERLPVSLEKSLLFLSIAMAAEKQKQMLLFADALDAAQVTATFLNDENTPFLLLFVSGQMAKNQNLQSDLVLFEAFKSFNKFENLMNPPLMHKVTLEPLSFRFNLTISGVNLAFQHSFENAIDGKEEHGIQIIEGLKDERFKGQAFVVLTKLILSKKPPIVRQNEQVVRVGEDGIRKSAVKTVMPVYPRDSLKKKVKGVVVAEIQYNGNGEVSEVIILESPDTATGEAVAQAMRQWKFKPSKLDDKPISVRGKITFYFVIDAKGKGTVENPKQFK